MQERDNTAPRVQDSPQLWLLGLLGEFDSSDVSLPLYLYLSCPSFSIAPIT